MPKEFKDYKNTFLILVIAVVLGGGVLIYGWNRLHGRDLIESPQFDLSLYENTDWYTNGFAQALNEQTNLVLPSQNQKEITTGKAAGDLEPGYIYLKQYFRQATAKETNELIIKFLSDFSELAGLVLENLEAKSQIEVELPALNREKIISALRTTDDIAAVAPAAPPIWIITLREPQFFGGAAELLEQISPEIKITTAFPSGLEYVARVDYRGLKEPENILNKLKKEYSDVALVK